MAKKRKPSTSRTQKKSDTRNTAVMKTALPIIITVLLLALVYLFVLVPVKPENLLRKALENTLNRDKQKSMRFDGTYGTSEPVVTGEYSGQLAANGDYSFSTDFEHKDQKFKFETRQISGETFLYQSGSSLLPVLISEIPGAKALDGAVLEALQKSDSKWVTMNKAQASAVVRSVSCINEIDSFVQSLGKVDFTKDRLPLEIVEGPYTAGDGSADQTFKVKFREKREVTGQEESFIAMVNCIDGLRGDDYRLREAGPQDIKIVSFELTIDTLSNTVRSLKYKQFGNYFQLFFRDFNKDVSVLEPQPTISIEEFVSSLSSESKERLLLNLGL